MARRDVAGVRLLTRNGLAWTQRYPGIAAAVGELRCRSCLLDGEVVICGEDGIPVFDRLRYGRQVRGKALLYAFDLLEFDGKDLRREPLEARKGALSKVLLGKARAGIQFNEHWAPTCQREQAARVALSVGAVARLAEAEKSRGAGRKARGGRRLGAVDVCRQQRRGKHGLGPKHGAENLP